MSNKVYDVLKWVATVALPAMLTCATIIMGALGVSQEVIATVATITSAVIALLGTLLGISSVTYSKLQESETYGEDINDEDLH